MDRRGAWPACTGRAKDQVLARISHTIFARLICSAEEFLVLSTVARPRGIGRRESCWNFSRLRRQRRSGLGGPGDDAAFVARCGAACQAGEPRALAAALRRMAASPQIWATGQPDAIAILMRRTLMRASAPILRNLRRMVPQVALANFVCCSPIRRKAQSST